MSPGSVYVQDCSILDMFYLINANVEGGGLYQ